MTELNCPKLIEIVKAWFFWFNTMRGWYAPLFRRHRL